MEVLVDRAANDSLKGEDWASILEICDIVNNCSVETGAKKCVDYLQATKLNSVSSNTVFYALTIVESCMKNCEAKFKQAIANKSFMGTLVLVYSSSLMEKRVKDKVYELLESWSNEFRYDNNMSVVRETFEQIKATLKPPSSPSNIQSYSVPVVASTSAAVSAPTEKRFLFQVKGLYDFAGLDEGELPFRKFDVLNVLEDSNRDWWKAEINGRIGLIPSNYVSRIPVASSSISSPADANVEDFDFSLGDRLLSALSTINPTQSSPADNDQVQSLYRQVIDVRPKLLKSIEFHNKKQEEYAQLLAMLEDGLSRYNKLASMPPVNPHAYYGGGGAGVSYQNQHPSASSYNQPQYTGDQQQYHKPHYQ